MITVHQSCNAASQFIIQKRQERQNNAASHDATVSVITDLRMIQTLTNMVVWVKVSSTFVRRSAGLLFGHDSPRHNLARKIACRLLTL